MYLKVQLSYAKTKEAAQQGAYDQWRANIFPNAMLTELRTPDQFDMAGELVNLTEVDNMSIYRLMFISTRPGCRHTRRWDSSC
jgi:hypothetical protein